MSEPDDKAMSFDPRTWVEAPNEHPAAAPPAAKREPRSRALLAGAAGACILAAGAIAAYATRQAPQNLVDAEAVPASVTSR